ncbi:solute carrier family 25 member 45 isoform X3 [Athalia rosae]|uniref:solute carrier family 25 member 45 isoform X3 n=1 Tax=Athalia rosae TaxID=37344 RepID=UPI002033A0E6|nr:solute carrier family 25 member 45 isoform X3 [Athalia rosae]
MDDLCNFIAGWGAGMIGLVVGHPMDTVKTNQQMMSKKVHGFYKGMLFPLLCSGTLNSVFFGIYAYCVKNMQELRGHPPNWNLPTTSGWYLDTFLGGCVGGLVQVVISCPSEVVKVRLQSGKVI